MRSRLITALATLIALAASSSAQGEGTSAKVADALFVRPVGFIVAVGGAVCSLAFIPYTFTDGAVRSVGRSTGEDQSFSQGAGDFFVEGARGFTRSFSQAAWCPAQYVFSSPLGNTRPCEEIAWSQQGVYAQ
jgi:hypothetical protein